MTFRLGDVVVAPEYDPDLTGIIIKVPEPKAARFHYEVAFSPEIMLHFNESELVAAGVPTKSFSCPDCGAPLRWEPTFASSYPAWVCVWCGYNQHRPQRPIYGESLVDTLRDALLKQEEYLAAVQADRPRIEHPDGEE